MNKAFKSLVAVSFAASVCFGFEGSDEKPMKLAFLNVLQNLSNVANTVQQNQAALNQAQNVANALSAAQQASAAASANQQAAAAIAQQQALLQQAAANNPALAAQMAVAAAQAQASANTGYDFIKGKSAKADIIAKFGNPTNVAQNGDIETWTYTYQNAAESAQAAVGVAKSLLSVASSFIPFGAQASQSAAIANDVANVAGKLAGNAAASASQSPFKSAVFMFSKNGVLSDYSIVK